MERKFKNSAPLASAIYIELVKNLKKITKDKGTTVSRGLQFEDECERELKASGFSIERTSIAGDFGIDIVARKDAMSCGIQCKNYSKPVGVSAVQEVESGRKYYSLDFAIVVAPSGFTPAARELAARSGILLVPPKALKNLDVLLHGLF